MEQRCLTDIKACQNSYGETIWTNKLKPRHSVYANTMLPMCVVPSAFRYLYDLRYFD